MPWQVKLLSFHPWQWQQQRPHTINTVHSYPRFSMVVHTKILIFWPLQFSLYASSSVFFHPAIKLHRMQQIRFVASLNAALHYVAKMMLKELLLVSVCFPQLSDTGGDKTKSKYSIPNLSHTLHWIQGTLQLWMISVFSLSDSHPALGSTPSVGKESSWIISDDLTTKCTPSHIDYEPVHQRRCTPMHSSMQVRAGVQYAQCALSKKA